MQRIEPDTLIDGRYRIVRKLGSGGMADVYMAEDQQLGRRVALKVLHRRFAEDEQFVERFRREASSAAGLSHPNVVAIFDRGEWDGTYYISMELVEGRTLKEIVREKGPAPPEAAVDLTLQILRAARYAHKHGVVHRDIKPHNVLIDQDGRVRVTDFGIARAGTSDITETGSVMGTAQYLSPEQAQGRPVDERAGPVRDRDRALRAAHRPGAVRRRLAGDRGAQAGVGDAGAAAPSWCPRSRRRSTPSCCTRSRRTPTGAGRTRTSSSPRSRPRARSRSGSRRRRPPPVVEEHRSRWWLWVLIALALLAIAVGLYLTLEARAARRPERDRPRVGHRLADPPEPRLRGRHRHGRQPGRRARPRRRPGPASRHRGARGVDGDDHGLGRAGRRRRADGRRHAAGRSRAGARGRRLQDPRRARVLRRRAQRERGRHLAAGRHHARARQRGHAPGLARPRAGRGARRDGRQPGQRAQRARGRRAARRQDHPRGVGRGARHRDRAEPGGRRGGRQGRRRRPHRGAADGDPRRGRPDRGGGAGRARGRGLRGDASATRRSPTRRRRASCSTRRPRPARSAVRAAG